MSGCSCKNWPVEYSYAIGQFLQLQLLVRVFMLTQLQRVGLTETITVEDIIILRNKHPVHAVRNSSPLFYSLPRTANIPRLIEYQIFPHQHGMIFVLKSIADSHGRDRNFFPQRPRDNFREISRALLERSENAVAPLRPASNIRERH